MNKKIYTLVIATLLVLSFNNSNGQNNAPGYIGKLNSLSYNFGFMIAPIDEFNAISFNQNHYIQYNRAVNRNMTMGITYSRYSLNNLEYDRFFDDDYFDDKYIDITGNDIALTLRIHQKKWIAPLGVYNELSLKLNNSKISNNYLVYKDSPEDPINPIINSISIGYSIGKTRILYKNLLIDFGIQTNFVISEKVFNDYSYNYDFNSSEEIINIFTKKKLFYNQLLRAKIGIGYVF